MSGKGKKVDFDLVDEEPRQKHAGGRPSKKTPALIEEILTQLMEGKSLVKVCKQEHMPSYPTVCAWLANDAEFLNNYTKARAVQADYLADEILDIADDSAADEIMAEDGRRLCNNEFIQRSKLRVDARKWVASKLLPKKYGEKVSQEITGADGGPVKTEAEVFVRPQITREEWLKLHGIG